MSDAAQAPNERLPLRVRLALYDLDGVTLLVLPAVLFVIALFVYPFLYGFVLSFEPKRGTWLANYHKFFSEPFLYDTIEATFRLAIPATLINVLMSIPVALRVRHMRNRRILTTILVIPITLGTVLIAEGLLNYLGPQGWFNRTLMLFGLEQIRLVHNYTGVMLSLILSGFPFTFLLTLSYLTGIDPSLEQAAATLGAKARQRFWHHPDAAVGAGSGDQFVPVVRADVFGVPLRDPARRAGGRHARDLDRRVPGRLRAI